MTNTATTHIVFGPQGAGKTTYSRKLAENATAVRFSIDEWMIELFGPDLPKSMSLSWIMPRVQRCEARIWSVVSQIGKAGGSVVLDLGFMRIDDRRRFSDLAKESGMASQLHFVDASHQVRRARVLARNQERGETFAFEVTAEMFDFMESKFESPTEAELAGAVQSRSS
jgi:predicted kinase